MNFEWIKRIVIVAIQIYKIIKSNKSPKTPEENMPLPNHPMESKQLETTRSNKFERLVIFVLDHEGREYENTPNDPGGETKFGISKKAYPSLDIKNLTEDQAKDIYYRDYWKQIPEIENMNEKLSLAIFDTAVNCGVQTAIDMYSPLTTTVAEIYLWKRLRRYANICQQNPKLIYFLLGWIIRALHIIERY